MDKNCRVFYQSDFTYKQCNPSKKGKAIRFPLPRKGRCLYMASVNWQKTNAVKLGRMGCHFDNNKRKIIEHTNKDINKNLTSENYYIGAENFQEIVERSKEYIADVDRKHPPKKKVRPEERITICSLEYVCPREITDMGLSKEFFKASEEVLREQFGTSYMGGVVHVDECHTYLDPQTKKIAMSCEHANVWVCADCCWNDNKGNLRQGINGKNFMTKQRMTELNKAIHSMCLEKFGIPYLTGGEARNVSVERLKQDSYDALKKEVKIMQRQIVNLTNERELTLKENGFLKEEIVHLQKEVAELSHEKERGELAIERLEKKFDIEKNRLDFVTKENERVEKINIKNIEYDFFTEKIKGTKDRETIYEVPENDLKLLLRDRELIRDYADKLIDINNREQLIEEREFEYVHKNQDLEKRKDAIKEKERELNKKEIALERDIDSRATERIKNFVEEYELESEWKEFVHNLEKRFEHEYTY